ncbi:MAG: hypothetical protein QOH37_3889 [Nocardioidaceae bacterium]|nr:hypothetical protein [Nocardioidaceae bacterium]
MERVWVFGRLAISVARIDFLDPAVADTADPRERGVRIEVRPATSGAEGSIYASPTTILEPAVCRIDFLESAPGAADRMHWHPEMHGGEPGSRTFDVDMPADPVGWLSAFLLDLGGFLARAGVPDVGTMSHDLEEIRATAPEIGADVEAGMVWARRTPWPEVERDERGMPALAT